MYWIVCSNLWNCYSQKLTIPGVCLINILSEINHTLKTLKTKEFISS